MSNCCSCMFPGAAAAAVMSSSKGPTVLRPVTGPGSGTGPPTVQHIIHQPIQSRPIVTTSTAVLPTVVAPVTATRPQSPVVSSATHSAEMVHGYDMLKALTLNFFFTVLFCVCVCICHLADALFKLTWSYISFYFMSR